MHGGCPSGVSCIVHGEIEMIGGGTVDRAVEIIAGASGHLDRDAAPREIPQDEAECHPLPERLIRGRGVLEAREDHAVVEGDSDERVVGDQQGRGRDAHSGRHSR